MPKIIFLIAYIATLLLWDTLEGVFYFLCPNILKNKRTVFLKSLFGIYAKLAMADGSFSQKELTAVEKVAREHLKLTDREYKTMVDCFNAVLANDTKSISEHLRDFVEVFKNDHNSRLIFLRFLFILAAADGILHPKEEFILKNVAVYLKISPTLYSTLSSEFFIDGRHFHNEWQKDQYAKDKQWQNADWYKKQWERSSHSSHSRQKTERSQQTWDDGFNSEWFERQYKSQSEQYQDPLRKHYAILGCLADCTNEELKKAYHKLVLENHPDRLVGRGLPPQAIKLASERFIQIKNAYDTICKARK